VVEPVIIGRATLYLGDCRDILPTLGKVDAVVTDPPYVLSEAGPGDSHFGMSLSKFDSADYKRIVSGFDLEVFDELAGICEPFNLFCFCSNRQVSQIMAYHEGRGRATTLCVWHKTNAAPFANGVWRGDIEYCVHARASGAVFVGNAQEKKKVWEHPIVQDDAHPTVKPLPIVKRLVSICSNPEQTILDPFVGSGTTGIAAVQLGRNFIGIEKDERHFATACKRIEDAQRQGSLFGEAA
jgi:DNA modification methylase